MTFPGKSPLLGGFGRLCALVAAVTVWPQCSALGFAGG